MRLKWWSLGVTVALVTMLILGAAVEPGSQIQNYPHATNLNDGDYFVIAQAGKTKSLVASMLKSNATSGFSTTGYVNSATSSLASTSYVNQAASNRVTVAAGANVTVTTNGSGGVMTYTVAASSTQIHSEFDNVLVTNAINMIRYQPASTLTTVQVDVANGPQSYYWTNMVNNVTCQFTNLWTSGVSNRPINFFFNGAVGGGSDYTVTFTCPNPGGVAFHWSPFIPTNGATSFTVTNGHTASAISTAFDTNAVESFYSPGI